MNLLSRLGVNTRKLIQNPTHTVEWGRGLDSEPKGTGIDSHASRRLSPVGLKGLPPSIQADKSSYKRTKADTNRQRSNGRTRAPSNGRTRLARVWDERARLEAEGVREDARVILMVVGLGDQQLDDAYAQGKCVGLLTDVAIPCVLVLAQQRKDTRMMQN